MTDLRYGKTLDVILFRGMTRHPIGLISPCCLEVKHVIEFSQECLHDKTTLSVTYPTYLCLAGAGIAQGRRSRPCATLRRGGGLRVSAVLGFVPSTVLGLPSPLLLCLPSVVVPSCGWCRLVIKNTAGNKGRRFWFHGSFIIP